MRSRHFQHLLIALAILVTQFAGLAHGIEHSPHHVGHSESQARQNHDWHGDLSSDKLLHSCLLFDGLATAQALPAPHADAGNSPLLSQLGTHHFTISSPTPGLFSTRVRVRDPPIFA